MRFALLLASLTLGLTACGGPSISTSTPVIEASEDYREPELTESEIDLFALQEEACSQPGARNRPVVIDGVTFHCFAD
ncbi:MAG: hypothetical protein AAGF12_11550 [Myxococcota bacterium]